jgi:hypothetical protein
MLTFYTHMCESLMLFIGLLDVAGFHPSNGATAQIGPWPPLLRFHNNIVLRCEVVSLTTNPH